MTYNYQTLSHPGIHSLHPYIPGMSIAELAKEKNLTEIIKLSSNENPLGCSPYVREALANLNSLEFSSYPAVAFHPLKNKLSEALGIPANQLTFGNGSDQLFSLILTVFSLHTNKHVLTHDKAFASYQIQAQALGVPLISTPLKPDFQVDIPAMIAACSKQTALIFLANPNNPTGLLIPKEKIRQLLLNIPASTLVVIDEAYYEYAYLLPENSMLSLIEEFPNVIITRTFSKAYGLAGLRIGYAIAISEITELLQRVQLPFTVNHVALTAALAALQDSTFLFETLELNAHGKYKLAQGLEALHLPFLQSHGNFITFDCKMNSLTLYQYLLKRGIIIRPLTAYGLTNHLRVSIGKLSQIEYFLSELAEFMRTNVC